MTHATAHRRAHSIARAGGLAVALGIGIAIANNAGVALADSGSEHRTSAPAPPKSSGKASGKAQSARKTQRVQARPAVSTRATVPSRTGSDPASPLAAAITDVLGYAGREIEQRATQRSASAAVPTSVLRTTDQLDAEKRAVQLGNSPLVQLAKAALKAAWYESARQNFTLVGGPDQANLAQLDQAVTEYATQAALEVQLLDSNNPKVIQQVSPPNSADFPGSRIWYDNPDTIYRFIGVNSASSYLITGRFTDGRPADTNFSVLTGLNGSTAANLNGRDMEVNPDGTFTITADSSPAAPGQTNHLQLVPGTTLITTRNTLSDWTAQDPMSLSVQRVSGPPPSLFSQIGGFAVPGIGSLVAGNPQLTAMFSLVPPLQDPTALQEFETAAIMLLLGISGENQYMAVATTDPDTGERRAANVLSDPGRNAQFLSTQLQSAGYFQLADDEALIVTIKPGKARYFVVPVTNDWTITDNYWDQQTSLNISQAQANSDGSYTIVVSPADPGVANWVSTGGLNQGTISIRFQDFDPASTTGPTVQTQVVPLSRVGTAFEAATYDRQTQIADRRRGFDKRYAL